jgi:hypothetical protein
MAAKIPPVGGKVKSTPGVKAMNKILEVIRSYIYTMARNSFQERNMYQ